MDNVVNVTKRIRWMGPKPHYDSNCYNKKVVG